MASNVLVDVVGGDMSILNTFTTVGPIGVCYPRLNSTVPLNSVQVDDPSAGFDSEGLDLVNKVERLGFGCGVRILLPEKSESILGL